MNDVPLQSATDAELAQAVEGNVRGFSRLMAEALGGEFEHSARLGRFHCWPGSPIFKGAWGAVLDSGEADATIDETIAWFEARHAPFFFWWTGADTRPLDLRERLLARGFGVFEENTPAMVADIAALNWQNPRPAELRLAPVADEADLGHWKRVFIESFGLPEFAGQAWVDATRAVGIGRTPWRLLLGWMGEEPVCCGLLACGGGVAGLMGLGTLPAHRGRGIGSAMQLERLRIARELGYRYAALFASPLGASAYRKLGFRDTGRRMSRYLWRKP
jgi:GNAT superfamily N-acetyltransferase